MSKHYPVPVAFFRPGAVIEFTPFGPARATQGTVKHLITMGGRHIIAILSRKVESDGTVLLESDKERRMPLLYDIRHASRVIQHGIGDPAFAQESKPTLRAEALRVRTSSDYARKGKRVVLTGSYLSAQTALRILIADYLSRNGHSLGIQPWEYFDEFAFRESLTRAGVVRQSGESLQGTFRLDVHIDRFVRYLRQNVNRFKRNLDELWRERYEAYDSSRNPEEYDLEEQEDSCYDESTPC